MTTDEINPLITASPLPDGAQPFNLVVDAHWQPAFTTALDTARARVHQIAADPEPPTFANTIEAIETASDDLDRVSGVFYTLLSADANDTREELARDFGPRLADYANDITLDPRLFGRVEALWDARAGLEIDGEAHRLLENLRARFVRNGARLSEEGKGRLRAIDRELALAQRRFGENVRKATNSFTLHVTDPNAVQGLPAGVLAAAADAARAKGHPDGWLLTLLGPCIVPVLEHAQDRGVRETLWRANAARAFGGEFDNSGAVHDIVRLRRERAQLLGYKHHAEYVLERRMAHTLDAVEGMVDRLSEPARRAAHAELKRIQECATAEGLSSSVRPWDFAFYRERLRRAELDFSSEELRPYLPLEGVLEGLFALCERIFGTVLTPRNDLPAWDPSVKVYEARDLSSGAYLGLLYLDLFPRPGKQPGAWATTLREQGLWKDAVRRPHAALICQFTPPALDRPTLLSFDEFRTLLHEMGHAMHMILSQCRYRSMAGTNVLWDFVELPSQLMENFGIERESLDILAAHYESGEKIPERIVARLKESARFCAGTMYMRQLLFVVLDMAWHGRSSSAVENAESVEQQEERAIALFRLFPKESDTNTSCSFAHIFEGGYAAGYYSYKWAEVLEADAFAAFQEGGVLNLETGRRLRSAILERGDTVDPAELFRRFRGRDPDPDTLLRRDGLI